MVVLVWIMVGLPLWCFVALCVGLAFGRFCKAGRGAPDVDDEQHYTEYRESA